MNRYDNKNICKILVKFFFSEVYRRTITFLINKINVKVPMYYE